jgi:hypothetical protein
MPVRDEEASPILYVTSEYIIGFPLSPLILPGAQKSVPFAGKVWIFLDSS